MSDLIRGMLERDRELRRLMNPLEEPTRGLDLTTSAAMRAAAGLDLSSAATRAAAGLLPDSAVARAASGLDIMRLQDERSELEARAAGFLSAAQYRDVAFDLIQRSDMATTMVARMEHEALLTAGFQNQSLTEMAAAAAGIHRQWEDAFRLPSELETRSLIQQQIEAAQAYTLHFGGRTEQEIYAAITGMNRPWLHTERMEQSVLGLVEMQAVGTVLRHADPFALETADVLRATLGDWRELISPAIEALVDPVARTALYHDQGLSPDLTAFPRAAFVEGLHHAGLDLDYDSEEVAEDAETEGEVDSAEEAAFARNRAAFDQLQRFEVVMRRFIDARMTEAYGPNWIATQTPEGISDNWRDKQAKEAKASGEVKPLIEFADFADYRPIIERKQNWKAVFAPVFNRPTDIQESFQRLYPVRIATMHARMITQDDEMLLTVETRRILKAIRQAK